MRPEFWRGKRVFLTGHTGFKGAWLSLWLKHLGADVAGYSLPPPTETNLFTLARAGDGISSTIGDVRDFDAIQRAIRDWQPDIVVHMAAQSLVRRSYQSPLETFSTNVMGTANVVEAVRQVGNVRAVLIVTSDKCYRNDGRRSGYTEADPLGGADPYSASKAGAEIVAGAYEASYFNDPGTPALASARAGNVIGGGDWAVDRLVPDVMGSLLRGESPVIRYPDAVRPWQHVLDCLNGYLMLAERLFAEDSTGTGPWNLGPDCADARTVRWLVDGLCARWDDRATWVRTDEVVPPEAHSLQLDSSKARGALRWQPKFTLEETLSGITDWYRSYVRGDDVERCTLGQIRAFEGRL